MMRLGLLAKKVGMSRFYDSSGINHPVTILKVDEQMLLILKQTKKMVIQLLDYHLENQKEKIINLLKVF